MAGSGGTAGTGKKGTAAAEPELFRKVSVGRISEVIVEKIRDLMREGQLKPGDRLPPERELTRRLGISRITLREALRELAAAGYVETKRGRFGGTFVLRQPEPMVHDELTRTARDMGAQLDDALTFRRVVETGAAEMAARASLTRQQRENLAECLAEVSEMLEHVDGKVAAIADTVQAGCVVKLPERS